MSDPFVERCEFGRVLLARLVPGDELFTALARWLELKGVRRAWVLGASGTVRDVGLRNLAPDAALPLSAGSWVEAGGAGPYTLLSLSGLLVPLGSESSLRLYASLGAGDGAVLGGQLDRATVFSSVEVCFAEIASSWAVRKFSDETGLAELMLADATRRPE